MVSALPVKKAIVAALVLVGLYTFALSNILASSGLVSQIGGATFIQNATQFWVTSSKPTFSGITTAGATVSGVVGPESVSATADASGNWSWTPAAELSGENAVNLTSGGQTASFTLTIGSLPESIATASASTLPPAGSTNPTSIALALGSVFLLAGVIGLSRNILKP